MGNIHTVTQVRPQFHHLGAAIKVRKGQGKKFESAFKKWKNKDNAVLQWSDCAVLCPNINEEATKFIPEERDLYLVIRSGSKYGYESDLNAVLTAFAARLEDAVFFIEDECQGYVRKYSIRNGKFAMSTVVHSGGSLLAYYRKRYPNDRQMLFRLLKSKALDWTALIDLFDYRLALRDINKALKENRGDWELTYLKGNALLTGARYKEARTKFLQALALKTAIEGKVDDFHTRNIYHAISLSFNYEKEFPTAIEYASKAEKIYPNFGNYRPTESKGYALMALGRNEEAITCFDEILKHSRERSEIAYAFYNKACALSRLGQFAEATTCLLAAGMLDLQKLPEKIAVDDALTALMSSTQGDVVRAKLKNK